MGIPCQQMHREDRPGLVRSRCLREIERKVATILLVFIKPVASTRRDRSGARCRTLLVAAIEGEACELR